MPERIASWWSQIVDALLFVLLGISIGIGQALRDREREIPVIVGRSVCTGGLAAAAGVVLIWWPEAPFLAQLGVAGALASLGTSFIEKLALKYVQSKGAA